MLKQLLAIAISLSLCSPASAAIHAIDGVADNHVTTTKLGDGAVTTSKIHGGALEPVYLDKSGELVGIRAASPTSVLTVNKVAGTGPSATEKGALGVNWVAGATSLEMGTYSGSPFPVYIQGHDPRSGQNATYPLALQPIGGNVGIGTTDPTTNIHVSSGSAHFKMATIDLVDDGTYAMETDFGSQGFVLMASDSVGRVCGWMLGGGGNAVTAQFDGASVCAEADSDGFFAMIADGDGTYTLKNRIGASQEMAILYIGF